MTTYKCRPHFFQAANLFGKEVDVLIMAEERIYVSSLRQDVAAPTIQHGDLEEGCEVLSLMSEKEMAWSFVEQAIVTIYLSHFVVQVKVLATLPNAPFGDPKQCRHTVRHR